MTSGLAGPAVSFYSHGTGTTLRLRGVLLVGADGREYVNVLVERGESAETRPKRTILQAGLTERESEIGTWAAQGKTNREIAIILGVSELTVKKHLENVFRVLGVETRTAAAAVLLESRGL